MKPGDAPELGAELLDDFYAECDEHLRHIREALVALEQSIGKAQADSKVAEELFRNFHSFKGISAIVGLRPAEELAHATEEFLRDLTKGKMSITAQSLDLLMAVTQKLEQVVSAFRARQPLPSHLRLLESIAGICEEPESKANPKTLLNTPVVSGEKSQSIDDARARGLLIWRCAFAPNRELDERGININEVRSRLGRAGLILSVTPRVLGEDKVVFDFLVAMPESPSDITGWENDGISVQLLEQEPPAEVSTPQIPSAKETPEGNGLSIAPSHFVRVDLNRLDDLMRIAGELVIQRSRFEGQISQSIRSSRPIDVRMLQEVNLAQARSVKGVAGSDYARPFGFHGRNICADAFCREGSRPRNDQASSPGFGGPTNRS